MTDFYEWCREVVRIVAPIALLWLMWRTVRAWPADWAKPDHVWHYRLLLIIGSGFLAASTWGAFWYTRVPATGVTALTLALSLLTLALSAWWPKPRAMRKDAP